MKSLKNQSKLLIACITLISVTALLKAGYYKPDFFPIGLTGLNYTGWNAENCPYGNVEDQSENPLWEWDDNQNYPDQTERTLIEALGVNCIGCEDAYRRYLLDFNPSSGHSQNNYLYKVCPYAPDSNPVYIITASYYTTPRVHLAPHDSVVGPDTLYLRCCTGPCKDIIILNDSSDTFFLDITDVDKCEYAYYYDQGSGDSLPVLMSSPTTNWPVNAMFRSPYRNYKYKELEQFSGSMQFSLRIYPDNYGCGEYNRHGRNPYDGDNWSIFGGDRVWCEMADEAVWNFDSFFTKHEGLSKYIWGWNLISEDPAVSRGDKINNRAWRGCWAAVDRIFRGSNSTGFDVVYGDRPGNPHGTYECTTHTGIRGVEETRLANTNRMIIAKQGTSTLHRGGYNIFEALPDLDAFLTYSHFWAKPYWNYGEQTMFDWFLYGDPAKPQNKGGRQNIAIYFQQYGNTPGPSGQKRRWLETIDIAWYTTSASFGASRRPCPPEIRCASYLSLSRGAKGIFFHGWTFSSKPGEYPNATIPCSSIDLDAHVGIRDHLGYPFGDSNSNDYADHHWLTNSRNPSDPLYTYWHGPGRRDRTYFYLKEEFIPEIKAISDVLMQLDWVNAYSLKTTCGKETSCPLHYVHDVSTVVEENDSGYIDLGFFEPHSPWWDYGKYLMVVNRDGIAQVDTATITLVLDFPTGSRLSVIEIGDPDSFYVLTKSGGYFYLVKDYEPGEGKLFRFYSIKEDDKPKLNLRGECKESAVASGFTQSLSGGGNPVAVLTWEWVKYKPWDLTKMELWKKSPSDTEWVCAVDTHPTHRKTYTFTYPMPCDSCCVRFLEVGYHVSGDTITWPTELEGVIGTKSYIHKVCCPNDYGGCPDLYTFFYQDTAVSPGHVFIENNTILPHSEHYQQMDEDLLRLDVLNDEPDHYYMAIVENSNETSYLDQVKLWVVDHDEGTQVATSADDSIYVYSEMVAPTYCKDNLNNDRLDEVLWEDTLVYAGTANSYLIVKFDEVEWAHTGLLLSMGDWRAEPAPAPKDYLSVPQKPGEGGSWDSLGVAYGRMNHSRWMVDVSDVDSLVFRIMCKGNDTTFIDRIALVKLESGWSKQEAIMDSAVQWVKVGDDYQSSNAKGFLMYQDTLDVALQTNQQISLCFDKVDSSTTYSLRDFVLQSRGYYSTTINPPLGIEEGSLQFGLRVEQLTPLSRIAFINYSVPYATHVKIAAYDVVGRLIKCIVDEEVKAGRYSEEWKGKDDVGRTLASGIYFVKMVTDDYKKTVKVVILE